MNSQSIVVGSTLALPRATAIAGRSLPAVMSAASAFLYLNLFLLPHTPILQGGDQVFFWMDAQRMLLGERVYRDFFQFTPPGTDLFFLALFKLFGPRIWVTNAAILVLGTALCGVCFWLARTLMPMWPAVLSALVFLTLIYNKLLNATHHWFSLLIILIAAGLAIRGRSLNRSAVVGALLGLAGFFTQTHALVAAVVFALWLVWRESPDRKNWTDTLKQPAVLFVSFAVVILALNTYFFVTVGLKQLWYYEVTFVNRYMAGLSRFPGLPEFPTWHRLPVVAQYVFVCMLLPAVYPLALFRSIRLRSRGNGATAGVVLLALLGAALFLEVSLSANWLRIYTMALPGIVLLVWCGETEKRLRYPALALTGTCMLVLALSQTWSHQHQKYFVAEFPAGTFAVADPSFTKLNTVMQRTQPGEFLFQAIWPGVYIPLQLRNPVFIDTVWPNEESRPEYIERAVAELEAKRVRFILWSPGLNGPDPDRPWADHLQPLREYLHTHFDRVQKFQDRDELWQRTR